MVLRVKDNNPPLARKRPFRWISIKSRVVTRPGKRQNVKTDNIYRMVGGGTWRKFCPHGVKLYPINKSINQMIMRRLRWENIFYSFLEHIDRLGIDYLIHNLPSDHRTFPMIAQKRKL